MNWVLDEFGADGVLDEVETEYERINERISELMDSVDGSFTEQNLCCKAIYYYLKGDIDALYYCMVSTCGEVFLDEYGDPNYVIWNPEKVNMKIYKKWVKEMETCKRRIEEVEKIFRES